MGNLLFRPLEWDSIEADSRARVEERRLREEKRRFDQAELDRLFGPVKRWSTRDGLQVQDNSMGWGEELAKLTERVERLESLIAQPIPEPVTLVEAPDLKPRLAPKKPKPKVKRAR